MKQILVLFGVLMLTFACQNKETSETNLHITGEIAGLKQGKLYIQKLEDTTLVVIDTLNFDGNSKFESHLKLDSPEVLYFFLDRGQTNSLDNNLTIFAEPGNLSIQTKLESFYADAVVKGSKNHELFQEFKAIMSRFKEPQLTLIEKEIKARKENNTILLDSINQATERLTKRKYLYCINYAIGKKDHEIAPYIALSEIYDAQIKYLDTIQKSLTPKVAESKYGKMLKKFIEERRKDEQVPAE
ncbi:DUF4369 domain-containing protein [Flavobacterium sp.]|uniref:DUF4369 domain-containing protein n=1 Tax=Flavobacterium sp. TaxID=239 RepID=UPI002FDADDD8